MGGEASCTAGGASARTRLVELRVLDGPNRFFNRPAVKMEFEAPDEGVAADVARAAADLVGRLHDALGMGRPAIAFRDSHDRRRAVAAFAWRRRAAGQGIGEAAARIALAEATWEESLERLRSLALGPLPVVPRPEVPVVAITGTNGKTTVTRLVAHIAARAGMQVGSTTSDGIYVRGELVEPGDWTGYGGAGRVLAEPGLDIAVLETARGGILLRGIGYRHNDVSVVTNISADHLGLQGIDTLEELAEVKATVVRLTRRRGWSVLNADDPLVWRMRRETPARIYAYSLEGSALVDETVDRGGRGARVQDGMLVLVAPGRPPHELVAVGDLGVALGGLSRHNVANALAAAAASDAIGIDRDVIGGGLRSFAQDTEQNPGRLNVFAIDGRLVIVDFAHNVAGLIGLLEVARGLAGDGRVILGLGTAGDRSDEILVSLGRVAARGADVVAICEKLHYLRGRDREEMNALFRRGIAEGGIADEVEAYDSEVAAVAGLVAASAPGDVIALMAHADRAEVFAWLANAGAVKADPAALATERGVGRASATGRGPSS